jgi:hypothetical protein
MIQRIAVDFDLLAEPLTVKDPQNEQYFERLGPFPVVGISDALVASQRAVKTDPVPAVSRPVSRESSKPVVSAVSASHPVNFDLLAEPVTVKDPQEQPYLELPVPFPFVEISDSPVTSQRSVKLDPIPAASRLVSRESSEPVVPAVSASHPVDYWRSVLKSFARDFRDFFRALTPP